MLLLLFTCFVGTAIGLLLHSIITDTDVLDNFRVWFKADLPEDQALITDPKLFENGGNRWRDTGIRLNRPMETVFIDPSLKQDLATIMDGFLDNEQWYENKYIPYKLGILIYGNLGDGKSSVVSSLAYEYGLDVYDINLSSCDDPAAAIRHIPTDRVNMIVFENLDFELSQLGTRYSQVVPKLLSIMDGLMSTQNQIIVVTATNLTGIPDEFKRTGRFNHTIHIKPPTQEIVASYFKWFYDIDDDAKANDFAASLRGQVPMSVIQNYLIRYRDDSTAAVKNAMSLSF